MWCIFLVWVRARQKKNLVGSIVVSESKGITLYSLELTGDPKDIALKEEVIFKVVTPDVESDRE